MHALALHNSRAFLSVIGDTDNEERRANPVIYETRQSLIPVR
jgi:hypothetical protein